MSVRHRALWSLLVGLSVACGRGDAPPTAASDGPATVRVSVSHLMPLDATAQGAYVVWALDASGRAQALGVLTVNGTDGALTVAAPSPEPAQLMVTVQRPDELARGPSAATLLRGAWKGGMATLALEGAVTLGGLPLKQVPGQFTMFSPSDNFKNGYPSYEECGVWLFNMAPRQTPQNDMWVRLSSLTPGWIYEGWMVRDYGTADAIWLSYGKFLPDATGAVATRDDTGWGAYSGVADFQTAGEEEFPGDDWFANPLGFPLPAGLRLPLDLREQTAQGTSRWTHVITIEPIGDRGEPIGRERPFAIRPYRDPFGTEGPGVPRTITFRPDGVPRGEAVRR